MTVTWSLLQTKTVALSSRLQKGSTWFSLFYKVHEVLNYNVTFLDFCLQLRHFKDTASFPREAYSPKNSQKGKCKWN